MITETKKAKATKVKTKKSQKGQVKKARGVKASVHKFESPLAAGRHYLEMKSKGMSVDDIVKKVKAKKPTIYKYLQLAESSEEIQKLMDSGKITPTDALRVFNEIPKKHHNDVGLKFLKDVADGKITTSDAERQLAKEFKKKTRKSAKKVSSKKVQEDENIVFPKTRGRQPKVEQTLNALHQKLSSRRKAGPANSFLMEFSKKLGSGANVNTLVQFVREKDKEMATS